MPEGYDADELFHRVKDALEEMDQDFAVESDGRCLRMMVNERNGYFPCLLVVWPDDPHVAVYTQLQCRVPEEKRLEMADFLNRANMSGWDGTFAMDADSGNVRYRTSLNLADGVLTTHMLAALLYGNANAINSFLPALMSVIWNDVSPEDAIGFRQDADEEAA
jgi:hypothetical protein